MLLDLLLLRAQFNIPKSKLTLTHTQENLELFAILRLVSQLKELEERKGKHNNPKNQIATIMPMQPLLQRVVMGSVRMELMARMLTEDVEI